MRGLICSTLVVLFLLSNKAQSFACPGFNQQEPLQVLYFTPESDDHSFWGMQRRYAKAVADNLNINLEIISINENQHNRFGFIDLVDSHLKRRQKTDLVLGIFYLNGEQAFLNFLDKKKVSFFSVNASLSAKNLNKIGFPREKYPYWIGHIAPNDQDAGFALAKSLYQLERQSAFMLAIAGQNQSTVSFNRETGLHIAQKQFQFELLPPIHTNWGSDAARNTTKTVLRRFPEINLIWAVGSHTAEGVVQHFTNTPGGRGEIKIGAFDWSPNVLEMLVSGQIDVSYGGHFREAGLALILAYDYFSGMDFEKDTSAYIEVELKAATKNNAAAILSSINQNWQDIDFKKQSKCHSPELKKYRLL